MKLRLSVILSILLTHNLFADTELITIKGINLNMTIEKIESILKEKGYECEYITEAPGVDIETRQHNYKFANLINSPHFLYRNSPRHIITTTYENSPYLLFVQEAAGPDRNLTRPLMEICRRDKIFPNGTYIDRIKFEWKYLESLDDSKVYPFLHSIEYNCNSLNSCDRGKGEELFWYLVYKYKLKQFTNDGDCNTYDFFCAQGTNKHYLYYDTDEYDNGLKIYRFDYPLEYERIKSRNKLIEEEKLEQPKRAREKELEKNKDQIEEYFHLD